MCLAVYIASDKELPLSSWNEDKPMFHTSELKEHDECVKEQFNLPNVVYAGTDESCGCGFLKEYETGEELKRKQKNYEELFNYLSVLKNDGAKLQLFSCWEGDQNKPKEFNEVISIDTISDKKFQFKEKALYVVS